jgi:hypothetical protein
MQERSVPGERRIQGNPLESHLRTFACSWRIVTGADLTGNRAVKVSCVSHSEPIRLQ